MIHTLQCISCLFIIIYLRQKQLKTAYDELWEEVNFCARFHNSVVSILNHILVEF